MKTRKEYLEVLPEDIRQEAILEMERNLKNYQDRAPGLFTDLSVEEHYLVAKVSEVTVLMGAIIFADTLKGFNYWYDINAKYFN